MGGTAIMTDELAELIADIIRKNSSLDIISETYELIGTGNERIELDDETVAVIGMPSYVGKIPVPAISLLENIKSNGAVAVVAVSFGSRSYGNALYELRHYAEKQDFKVVGAGAFPVMYRRQGRRGDDIRFIEDSDAIELFGKAAAAKICRLAGCDIEGLKVKPAPLEVSGRLPVHLTSRILPSAAAAAQEMLDRICIWRKDSEWYL